jgi:cell division protein FtsB
MPSRSQLSPASFRVTRTMVWLFLIGYSLFLVGRSTYQNYTLNHDIVAYKGQISGLQKTNGLLQLSLVYYQSQAFKEVAAREHLGLQGPNEHVVALPNAKTEPALAVATDTPTASEVAQALKLPPYQAWINLFFSNK